MKRLLLIIVALLVLVPAAILGVQLLHDPGGDHPSVPVADAAAQIRQGAYLARAGDCMACHTTRGGSPFAGGRRLATAFGDFYSPNITPDPETGIGSWSADDFWRALHNGKSKNGSFLYPAFPYPNYTKVTRADSDAIYAYFKSLEPVRRRNEPHALRFPFNQRILLAGWRALYFRPGVFEPDTGKSAEWNRGAYLVNGLGHCAACHTNRNAVGAPETRADLAGGMIPVQNWYAAALTPEADTGLGDWDAAHIAQLLKTGISPRGAVFGPMSEVVRQSLQHLSDSDINAMAGYLKALPPGTTSPAEAPPPVNAASESVLKSGAVLYEKHCAECHQDSGQGYPPHYPPLAGNRSIAADSAINPIRIVLNGGYPPSTEGNPRPYGMPPYSPVFNDAEVAAVVSYIRASWGNRGTIVRPSDVARYRGAPLD